ncbi:hypothetical protein ACFQ3Z_38405 [Streptomyces nogalater]
MTSAPGESARRLRRLFYTWLKLPEPAHPAATRAIPVPSPAPPRPGSPICRPPSSPPPPPGPGRRRCHRPDPALPGRGAARPEPAPRRRPSRRRPRRPRPPLAALRRRAAGARRARTAPGRGERVLPPRRFPGCGLVAVEEAGHGCTALFADGTRLQARWTARPAWASFAVAASAAHAWVRSGPVPLRPGTRARLTVRAGDHPEAGLVEFTVR